MLIRRRRGVPVRALAWNRLATQPEPGALRRGMFGAEGHHRTRITDVVRTCSLAASGGLRCRGIARKGLQ